MLQVGEKFFACERVPGCQGAGRASGDKFARCRVAGTVVRRAQVAGGVLCN